jgi:predicted deacylase
VILDGRNPETIVVSPEDGMWEAMLEPGDAVREGEPVGRLWFIDRPDRPAEPILAPMDGVVAVTKAIPVTEQGDCVFVLGVPIDRTDLL